MFSSTTTEQEPDRPSWENVLFVSDYYDIPLEGVAHFQGAPHLFFLRNERWIPDIDNPDDGERVAVYALFPIPTDLTGALEEKNAIFERWWAAWRADPARMKDHPALPEDRARYDALKVLVGPRLDALRRAQTDLQRVGDFVRDRQPEVQGQSPWMRFQVQWADVPDGRANMIETDRP